MMLKRDYSFNSWLLLCGILLLGVPWNASADNTERLRIASWNVRNYLVTDRWVEDRYRTEYPKPEQEKQAMWSILKEVNPDILLIQEMGNEPFLLELQRDLKREGVDYPYIMLATGTADKVRHLALMSKLPLVVQKVHTDLDFRYYGQSSQVLRGLQEVVIDRYEQPLVVMNVHLKSRYTDNSNDPQSARRRQGEARVTRDRIFSEYPPQANHWLLIAGDFNDHPNSSPVKHFLKRGKVTLMERVQLQDSRGERWTHFYAYQESYSSVDHILVSPALAPFIVEGSGRIYDRLPYSNTASDHRLVCVDLELTRREKP